MFYRVLLSLAAGSASSLVAPLALAATAPVAHPAAAPSAAPAAVKPAGPSDKAQIEALESRFAAAFNAKDVGRIMSCYAREGLFVFDVAPPRQYAGWDAYKKDWDGLMASFAGPVTFKLSDLDITVVGSVAYGHSIQDVKSTGANGQAEELVVRVSDVWRKTAGKWRIVQEHVSIPVDLDTDRGDMLSKP